MPLEIPLPFLHLLHLPKSFQDPSSNLALHTGEERPMQGWRGKVL